MFVHETNHKGNIAELAIAAEFAKCGVSVLKPLTEHERYDLGLEMNGSFIRVQCKWASQDEEVLRVHLSRSRRGPDGLIGRRYTRDEIDAIAAYCGDLDRAYLIPFERVEGQWALQMRLTPPRNGQRAAVHFAAEYELPGAVAQWEERLHGMQEAGGSSPPSSTSIEPPPSGSITVGAHEFRNRFGWYMERAAAGESFLVTRRGKLRVRLTPA